MIFRPTGKRNQRLELGLAGLAAFLIFLVLPATAQNLWETGGARICTAPAPQEVPAVSANGSGGGIFVWYDARRYPLPPNVYAQQLAGDGSALWVRNGVPVARDQGYEFNPVVVSDDSAGAIVVWQDSRPGSPYNQVYAQRVDPLGSTLWATGGIPVSPSEANQFSPLALGGGAGGTVLLWLDYRNVAADIYAQRLNRSGEPLWEFPGGVPVCQATGDQVAPAASTFDGTTFVAWEDYRGPFADIFLQIVSEDGEVELGSDGSPLCQSPGDQKSPSLCISTWGTPVVAWEDYRTPDSKIYFLPGVGSRADHQRSWPADGFQLCEVSSTQREPEVVRDMEGGGIIFWVDYRSGDADLYVQRVDPHGQLLWDAGGVLVCGAVGDQVGARAAPDGGGGAIVVWQDSRSPENPDLYAQRIDASGSLRWDADGFPVCTFPGLQWSQVVVSDGLGGALVVWEDYRGGLYADVYGQRLNDTPGMPEQSVQSGD